MYSKYWPGADRDVGQPVPLPGEDPGGEGLVLTDAPGEAVRREEMSRHCGVPAVLLPQSVGVAEDVEVSSSVPPYCRILKGRSRPGGVPDLKTIVNNVEILSRLELRHQVIDVYSC